MKNMSVKSVWLIALAMISSLLFADGTAISSEGSKELSLSNASDSAEASENVINSAYYDFNIPPSENLPAGSIVRIKSISLSGFNSSYTAAKADSSWADSAFINLNGVRSNPVNGGTVSSSQYSGGVWDGTIASGIASGMSVNGTLLKYEFSSDCLIVVGKPYPASSNGSQGGVGCGITLLHANGMANGSGGNNFQSATAVRFIKTNDENSIISFAGSKSEGFYPVYSIELEVAVLWTGNGSDNKMSNPDNWSTHAVPETGALIGIDSTGGAVTIEADISLNIAHLLVQGENTITFTGSGENKFTAAEVVAEAPIVVNGRTFCPQSVIFGTNGSLSIGEEGFLSDITFSYEGALPQVGNEFTSTTIDSDVTNAERWGGTVWLKNINVSDFNPNKYGHGATETMPASTVKLSRISGYFPNKLQIAPVLELVNGGYSYALNIINGYSRSLNNPDNIIVIEKLKGDGAIWTDGGAPTVLVNIKNFEDYSGAIQLPNKIVVLGDVVPEVSEHNSSGTIYIGTNVVATIPINNQWRADGGIHVKGELKVADAINERIRSGTRVVTYDTGVVTLTGVTGDRWNFDYSRIEGTGALCFAGTSWCSLTTNNTISTSLTVKNEQPGGLVVPPYTPLPDGEKNYICEIGSLSGSGSIRGDYNWVSGEDAVRTLRIRQSKDTEWSGVVGDGYGRIGKISVAPGESRSGILTLSGMAQNSVALQVEASAKVNVTGKWKGDVTVSSGSVLSGTGMIEGNLILSDGSILRANNESETPLKITGRVTSSENATVTIEIPEDKTTRRFVLITANSGLSNINFVCTNSAYSVRVTDKAVTVSRKGFSVIVR